MNKGFTLIELLVVVLIIGILAAVALPQYTKAVEKSRTAEVVTLMGDIMTGERIYQLSQGGYTIDLTALDIEVPGATAEGVFTTSHFNGQVDVADDGAVSAVATRDGSSAYKLGIQLTPAGVVNRACENAASGSAASICASMPDWSNSNGFSLSDE